MKTIGFIGLGNLGAPLALKLIDAGYDLICYDIRAEALARIVNAGGLVSDSPKSIADQAEIVLACLPTPQASLVCALGDQGVIHGTAIKVLVELSALGLTTVQKIGEELHRKQIELVDAPVIGGNDGHGIADGSFSLICSGPSEAVVLLKEIFDPLARQLLVVGSQPGLAQICKTINNAIGLTWFTIACEGLALAAQCGIAPSILLEVLKNGSCRSGMVDRFSKGVIAAEIYLGPMANQLKDLELYDEIASFNSVDSIVGGKVLQVWRDAMQEDPKRTYRSLIDVFLPNHEFGDVAWEEPKIGAIR